MAIMTRKRRRQMIQAETAKASREDDAPGDASSPPPAPPPPPPPAPPLSAIVLPEELIIEILSRVPVKNPLQFRCVCKSWKSLVSDPQFVKNHLHRSITDINDLASKALEDMNAFELQLNFGPAAPEEDVEEEAHVLLNEADQLDNLLVGVQCLKGSLETIKVDVQEIKDRMRCLQNFLQIYLKAAAAAVAAPSQSM